MKKTFFVIGILLQLSVVVFAQEPDSMRYFVERFTDSTLSASERRIAGLKIRSLQKARYLNSKKDTGGADTLIASIEQQVVMGITQVESTIKQLCEILSDPTLSNYVKWRALNILSKMNTYKADSTLIANIDSFHYLSEHPGGSGGEIAWRYPCFSLIDQKSSLNYSLLTPIIDNLATSKNEDELYLIQILFENIFSNEQLLKTWLEAWIARTDNPIMITNFESIKNIKK
jgi:hypothetical protein